MKMELSYKGYLIEGTLTENKERLLLSVNGKEGFQYSLSVITERTVTKALEMIKMELKPKEEVVKEVLAKIGFADSNGFEEAIDEELMKN